MEQYMFRLLLAETEEVHRVLVLHRETINKVLDLSLLKVGYR
jgi:hypothetical protein